ncbi:MAG: multicopper oxidase family protein, partial [Candidatus Methanoperedens sp.]
QELGLYGNILVEPRSKSYFNPVDKEVALFLDDIKIVNGDVEPFSRDYASFALTGRFGDIMLANGETDYQLNVKKGEVIRFYLTSSSNTRPFNFSIEDHTMKLVKMKLVGGDSGKYEKESFVDSVILGVSERYIVEVLFDKSGTFRLLNNIPVNYTTAKRTYVLGTVNVSEISSASQKPDFFVLKENTEVIDSIKPFKKYISAKPDYEIYLSIDIMGDLAKEIASMPKEVEPIEWDENEDMAMMNSMSTSENVKWMLKDKATGKENPNYQMRVGDVKKIRIYNDPNSMHPMQHPMHLHGQRFLVLAQDGRTNDNLVWKDTVFVPAGSAVDILIEFTNPGEWLMHCHIPEHAEAGMIASFTVSK